MTHPLGTARTSPLMLPPPSASSPSLFGITADIRQRVHRFLRLAPWDGRPYKFTLYAGWLKLRHGRDIWNGRYPAPDANCFNGLLLSCRTIHAEAASLLYLGEPVCLLQLRLAFGPNSIALTPPSAQFVQPHRPVTQISPERQNSA
jgi:hypothetical protein